MKKILKYALTLLLSCFLLAGLVPGRAEAATLLKTLFTITNKDDDYDGIHKYTASYTIDINGDGKADTVKAVINESDWEPSSIKIYIAGKTAYTLSASELSSCFFWTELRVRCVKLSSSTVYLDVSVKGWDEFDCFHKLFKFNNSTKKLDTVRDMMSGWGKAAMNSKVTSVGSSYLYVTYLAQPDTTGLITYKVKYTLKDGKLSCSSTTSKVSSNLGVVTWPDDGMDQLFAENLFQCAKKLSFKTKVGGSTTAFTGKKLDMVKLTKLKLGASSSNLYGYFNRSGKNGWLKLSGVSYSTINYDYDDMANTGYFRGVGNRLGD